MWMGYYRVYTESLEGFSVMHFLVQHSEHFGLGVWESGHVQWIESCVMDGFRVDGYVQLALVSTGTHGIGCCIYEARF